MRVFKVTFGDEDDVKDLSATSCDLLSKLVEQFHELYNYFDDMFSSDELIKLGVIEVKKIEELELPQEGSQQYIPTSPSRFFSPSLVESPKQGCSRLAF